MVSNFDRILREIKREANLVAPDHGLAPETIVSLIMRVVDIEDRHRVKAEHRVHQRIKGMIRNMSRKDSSAGDA